MTDDLVTRLRAHRRRQEALAHRLEELRDRLAEAITASRRGFARLLDGAVCDFCERCTWNPGPDCGKADHPHCPTCGHCTFRHDERAAATGLPA